MLVQKGGVLDLFKQNKFANKMLDSCFVNYFCLVTVNAGLRTCPDLATLFLDRDAVKQLTCILLPLTTALSESLNFQN